MIANNIEVIANEFRSDLYILAISTGSALKRLLRDCRRSPWFPLVAIAGGALLGLIAVKLIALLGVVFDISFLRDTGNNVDPSGAAGGAGAGAGGGAGWPGGKDPYPHIGMPDNNPGSPGSGAGGSSNGKDPWWKDWIPHNIPIVGGTGLNVFNGRVEGPGFSAGAAPGSDPAGPIVDVNYGVPGLGSHGPQGNVSVSVNQQNVPLTGAGSTTPTGRQILNSNMSSNGTYNNIGN
jgi:hypothetical protein